MAVQTSSPSPQPQAQFRHRPSVRHDIIGDVHQLHARSLNSVQTGNDRLSPEDSGRQPDSKRKRSSGTRIGVESISRVSWRRFACDGFALNRKAIEQAAGRAGVLKKQEGISMTVALEDLINPHFLDYFHEPIQNRHFSIRASTTYRYALIKILSCPY